MAPKTTGFLLAILLSATSSLRAQELFFTREGYISFLSETRLERIFAETSEAHSFFNVKTGEVAFSLNIDAFRFRIKLMQEHFNEQYMETARYPRAIFSGKIENLENLDLLKPSEQSFLLKGKMTIKGVTHEIATPVKFEVSQNGRFSGHAEFQLKPEDYGIKIPSVVGLKIAKEVVVTVRSDYQPYTAQ